MTLAIRKLGKNRNVPTTVKCIQPNLFDTYYPIGAIVRETTFYHRPGIVVDIYPNGYHRCYPIPFRGGDIVNRGDKLKFIAMFRLISLDEYIACQDEIYRFVVAHSIWLEDIYYKFSNYCGDKNPRYQDWLDTNFNSRK